VVNNQGLLTTDCRRRARVIPKQLDSPSTSLLGVKQLSGGHGPVSPDTPHPLAGNPGTDRKPRSHGTRSLDSPRTPSVIWRNLMAEANVLGSRLPAKIILPKFERRRRRERFGCRLPSWSSLPVVTSCTSGTCVANATGSPLIPARSCSSLRETRTHTPASIRSRLERRPAQPASQARDRLELSTRPDDVRVCFRWSAPC
jgi:hypothetical protein